MTLAKVDINDPEDITIGEGKLKLLWWKGFGGSCPSDETVMSEWEVDEVKVVPIPSYAEIEFGWGWFAPDSECVTVGIESITEDGKVVVSIANPSRVMKGADEVYYNITIDWDDVGREEPPEPDWKKWLKYGGIIGGIGVSAYALGQAGELIGRE